MNGPIDIFTLISLVVAVVVILKLRSTLGRKTGDEQSRYDRYTTPDSSDKSNGAARNGKVVTLPRRGGEDHAMLAELSEKTVEEQESQIKKFTTDKKLADGLITVFRADKSFMPEEFVNGAKMAYELIVNSFAEGNRKTLKGLLSRDVFDGFSGAIADRESRNEKIDQNFVGISKADILDAELVDNSAQITVKFVSELISATLNRSGAVISGDPNAISEVTDVWTFARDVNSRDPNWKLIATQAA